MNEFWFLTSIIVGMLVVGWCGHILYYNLSNQRTVDGLRFVGNYSQQQALENADDFSHGDWICVNIRGMTYERAIKVCEHETAHEIFAEYCEKGNIDKCMNITNQ